MKQMRKAEPAGPSPLPPEILRLLISGTATYFRIPEFSDVVCESSWKNPTFLLASDFPIGMPNLGRK